jgi:hypothetical protein
VYGLSRFLTAFDVSTVYPLLLWVMNQNVEEDEWHQIASVLESYVLRRAVCDFTSKNYNRVFLRLIQSLQKDGKSDARAISDYLAQPTGESSAWPTDDVFAEAWRTAHAYRRLTNPKMVYVLEQLSRSYLATKRVYGKD